jgi:hypothetical protein
MQTAERNWARQRNVLPSGFAVLQQQLQKSGHNAEAAVQQDKVASERTLQERWVAYRLFLSSVNFGHLQPFMVLHPLQWHVMASLARIGVL